MLTIIGCGNANRSDDAAGVVAAQRLQRAVEDEGIKNVRVFDAGTSGMDTMFHARGSDALIIVDANISDSEPGTVFEVPGNELENVYEAGHSLHDFRWDHAILAGRKIFKEDYPEDVTVFLIEVESTDLGLTLSAPVEQAVDKVVGMIRQRIDQRGSGAAGRASRPDVRDGN